MWADKKPPLNSLARHLFVFKSKLVHESKSKILLVILPLLLLRVKNKSCDVHAVMRRHYVLLHERLVLGSTFDTLHRLLPRK